MADIGTRRGGLSGGRKSCPPTRGSEGTRRSARPGQLCRPQLAEDRSHVLERPLFADLSVVPDAINVYGVPLNGAAGRGDPEQVACVGCADDETQGHQILVRDDVLDLGLDPRERADEPAENGDDGVDAGDGPEGAAVPHDIGREEISRALCVLAVEDAGKVIAGDGHPLLGRESLDHGFPPECLSWQRPSSRRRMGTRIQEVPSPRPGVTSSPCWKARGDTRCWHQWWSPAR